jgi:hypothetical protein
MNVDAVHVSADAFPEWTPLHLPHAAACSLCLKGKELTAYEKIVGGRWTRNQKGIIIGTNPENHLS